MTSALIWFSDSTTDGFLEISGAGDCPRSRTDAGTDLLAAQAQQQQ